MPSKELEEAHELCKCKDRLGKAQKRKSDTILEAEAHRAYSRQVAVKTRASETVEEITEHKASDRQSTLYSQKAS